MRVMSWTAALVALTLVGCVAETSSPNVGEAAEPLAAPPPGEGESCDEVDPRDHADELDEVDDPSTDPPTFPNVNAIRFEGCSTPRRQAFERAADALLANWSLFENNLVAQGISLPVDCLQRRLSVNGRLRCAGAPGPRDHCPSGRAGWTVPGSTRSRACRGWMTDMERVNAPPDETAVCQGTLMMHEFAHGCVSTESRAEAVDNAARATLNALLGTSRSESFDCRLDP